MKLKIFLLSTIFLFSFLSNAQEDSQKKTVKPSKGNFSFELDFLPFSSNGPINLNAFRGRYFINDKLALNVNVNFDFKKYHDERPVSYQNALVFNTDDGKYSVFGLGTGLEYHFLNAHRISPYIGVNIAYEIKRSKYEGIENHYQTYPNTGILVETKTEIENSWRVYDIVGYNTSGYPYYGYIMEERAYNSIKANIVLGADVYLIKHLYMGVELGLGVNSLKYKEVVVKEDGNFDIKYPETTDLTFGLIFNNAVRLGFWF